MNVTLTPSQPVVKPESDILLNGCQIGVIEHLTPENTYNNQPYRAIIHIQNKDGVYLGQAIGRGEDEEAAIISALANGEKESRDRIDEIER